MKNKYKKDRATSVNNALDDDHVVDSGNQLLKPAKRKYNRKTPIEDTANEDGVIARKKISDLMANSHRLLLPEEEQELAERIAFGDELASHVLVLANQRLVINIAYESALPIGATYEDVIADGNIGLMRAAKTYKPGLAKFSTYAAHLIKQRIRLAAVRNHSLIRLPDHVWQKISTLRRVAQTDDFDAVSELGVSKKTVDLLETLWNSPMSLQAPMNGQEGTTMTVGDNIPDNSSDLEKTLSLAKDTFAILLNVVESLPPREQYIIAHRFGLKGLDRQPLKVLGKREKLSRERIRQIEESTLKKIRRRLQRSGITQWND